MGLPNYQTGDRNLNSRDVLDPLVKGGFISALEAEQLLKSWTKSKEHPLTLATELTLIDRRSANKTLTQDDILSYLALYWNTTYFRVDPLGLC
jgi:hypothetical protein